MFICWYALLKSTASVHFLARLIKTSGSVHLLAGTVQISLAHSLT